MESRALGRRVRTRWRRFIARRAIRRAAAPELRSLAFVIRRIAQHTDALANDVPDVRAECNAWARHVVAGGPSPRESATRTGQARDWRGLRSFVARTAKSQRDGVLRAFWEVRGQLWDCIRLLTQDSADTRAADGEMTRQLERLREASRTDSLDELQTELNEAVATIEGLIRHRQTRQKSRIETLGTRLKSMREELSKARQEMALDPMTRLFNRAAFDEELQRTFELCSLFDERACLIMLDIDRFKEVNDHHGHATGDQVLRAVADAHFRSFPRQSDFAARYGGDETAVIVRDVTLEDARSLAEQFLEQVRKTVVSTDADSIQVTVSVGVAAFERGDDAASWLKRADEALYEAKNGGRDRAVAKAGNTAPDPSEETAMPLSA